MLIMDHLLRTNMMKSKKHGKKTKKGIKVVYISSPMKVKTSASEFRALVQELTGKDSDTARFMDDVNGNTADDSSDQQRGGQVDYQSPSFVPMMSNYNDHLSESSPSSDSVFEPVFDELFSGVEGSFTGLLQSSFFLDSSQIDVFN